MIDERVLRYATPAQAEKIHALNETGSARKAADKLGVTRQAIQGAVKEARKKAARYGYAPEADLDFPTGEGYYIRSRTREFKVNDNGEAEFSRVWLKEDAEAKKTEDLISDIIGSFDIPRVKPVPPPPDRPEDLLNLYTLTDVHLGMLAWHREGGSNWNIDIARETLISSMRDMIDRSPKAHTAVINQGGDFLHADSLVPVTPTSGHILDADSRYPKVFQVAIKCVMDMIEMCLETHEKVHVIMQEGNHDITSSIALRTVFSIMYENEPRVTVDTTHIPFYVYQHGKTMLCFHHGHMKKKENLPLMFAASHPEVWGTTKFRYAHTGHWHHRHEKEEDGMEVIQHPTIAARDAFSSRHGYHANRASIRITYGKESGELDRSTTRPELLGISA